MCLLREEGGGACEKSRYAGEDEREEVVEEARLGVLEVVVIMVVEFR